MAKLLINSSGSNKVTLPKQTIKELGWSNKTQLDIKRVGKKVVIEKIEG
jgi:bifunctional DNA-binding transcriptional regulator/antitoxin component of YhaV-PrlF toxin-antitoxin module